MSQTFSLQSLVVLAQDVGRAAGGPSPFLISLLPWMAIAFLFYMLLIRPQKQERKKKEEALTQLKKNDRVVTIGGIIGTIADVSPEKQIITIKVDDNTRIKFQKSAIQGIYDDSKTENMSS